MFEIVTWIANDEVVVEIRTKDKDGRISLNLPGAKLFQHELEAKIRQAEAIQEAIK